jgi:exopolyphosphatase/guanosine-5'-triphosphate,3'-diphosphate pyrophosphatase
MSVDQPTVARPKVGIVDIGTNSMRLLITDGEREDGRWVEVTGLGQGVDVSGRLADDAVARAIEALGSFGSRMDRAGVSRRRAIATSATRDASNSEAFLDSAAEVLGVRPDLISGVEEARLAYAGAADGFDAQQAVIVSDIGGGSTEFVRAETAISIDIGSVRLTERRLPDRPADRGQIAAARSHVLDLFESVEVDPVGTHIGVAGTWTSLSAISQQLSAYDRSLVHGHVMTVEEVESAIERLATMSVGETAAIPSLDPRRAPVILAGSVVAACVMEALSVETTIISERDTLDGVASELLALA